MTNRLYKGLIKKGNVICDSSPTITIMAEHEKKLEPEIVEPSTTSVRKKKKRKKKGTSSSSSQGLSDQATHVTVTTNFEEELEWCIRQLELGLQQSKVTVQQKQESEQLIAKLRSSKTPLPRKRQLMRSTFGDYREKMKTQPLSTLPITSPKQKIESVKDKNCDISGHFFRHSIGMSSDCASSTSVDTLDTIFKFNFKIPN